MIDFRSMIAYWRKAADFTQAELDEACGFPSGTVQRLEQKRLILKDEQLVLIFIRTNRNLLWTISGVLGALFRQLEPLDARLRAELGVPETPVPDDDPEYQEDLDRMFSAMQSVAKRMYRAADPRTSFRDFLLRAAADIPLAESRRRRARTRKKQKDAKALGS
jgi:transcriptional regulator with XRE-family HTH domain